VTIIYLGHLLPGISSDATRKADGPPEILPYLVLLHVGFTEAGRSPDRWCALTAPFHPYRRCRRFKFLWHCPWGHPRWTLSSTLPYGARTFLICWNADAIVLVSHTNGEIIPHLGERCQKSPYAL